MGGRRRICNRRENDGGEREGFNTLVYAEHEIERICTVAADLAARRGGRLDRRRAFCTLRIEFGLLTQSTASVTARSRKLVRNPG